jgi:hypothetical protein
MFFTRTNVEVTPNLRDTISAVAVAAAGDTEKTGAAALENSVACLLIVRCWFGGSQSVALAEFECRQAIQR